MPSNRYKAMTDEMFEFYTSCKESGFTDFQASQLTEKVYAVTLTIDHLTNKRASKADILRRYNNRYATQQKEEN